jgi:hypothetical protein
MAGCAWQSGLPRIAWDGMRSGFERNEETHDNEYWAEDFNGYFAGCW